VTDTSDFDYRFATESDVDSLIAFWSTNGENAGRPVDSSDLVRQLIARDPKALIVAPKDQQIKGTVIAGWDGWRGSIYRLAVEDSARRNGLGRHLMKLAELRLAGFGAERVGAMVLEPNQLAHSFYSKLEYSKQDEWRRWVKELHPSGF
jgi:ribosomal protein S18 acetylase RimI-like enzyme